MKAVTKVAIFAALVYFAFAVGATFHTHPNESESGKLQCNLCQISHASVEVTATWHIASETFHFGICPVQFPLSHEALLAGGEFGRAPPLS